MFKLSNYVSIIVPSTQGIADKASASNTAKQVENIATKLSLLNGGATITKGVGTWYSDELKKLVTEEVTIVKSYCESYDIEKLVEICETLKQEMQQEAVSLEVNGELYLI